MKKSQLLGAVCAVITAILYLPHVNAASVWTAQYLENNSATWWVHIVSSTDNLTDMNNITGIYLDAAISGPLDPAGLLPDTDLATLAASRQWDLYASTIWYIDINTNFGPDPFISYFAADFVQPTTGNTRYIECYASDPCYLSAAFLGPDGLTTSLTHAGGLAILELTATSEVPAPAAIWLFGSGLLGLIGISRRKNAA